MKLKTDNIDLRFQSLYDIVSTSWIQNTLVQKNSDPNFDPENGRKYIKNLAKRTTKGSIPVEAPKGFSFCLAGAAMYVGGPTEEEITVSLGIAATLKNIGGYNTLKELITDGVFDVFLNTDCVLNCESIDDEDYYYTVKINGKTKNINDCRDDEIFGEIYRSSVKMKHKDELFDQIFEFNDEASSKKEILNLIKSAKKVNKVAESILINGKTYTPSKLKKALGF